MENVKITDLNKFLEDYNNLTSWDKEKFFKKIEDDIPVGNFSDYEFDLGDIFYNIDPWEFIDYYGYDNILDDIGTDYIEEYLDNHYCNKEEEEDE